MKLLRPVTMLGAVVLATVGLPLLTAAPAEAACGGLLQPKCINAVVRTDVGYPTTVNGGNTFAQSGTFHFTVTEPQPGLLYRCMLTPVETAFVDCTDAVANNVPTTGSRSYTNLAFRNGYVMQVQAAKKPLLGEPNWGPTASYSFNVIPQRPDGTVPDTRFGGELPRFWYLGYFLSVDLLSTPKAARFECRLDGVLKKCGPGHDYTDDLFNIAGITPGDHTMTAAAIRVVDGQEIKDPTPAVLRFCKPQRATLLTGLRGFHKDYKSGPMMGQYVWAEKKGASLTKGFQGLRRLALVVTKAPGHGALKVFIGKKLIKIIRLDASRTMYKQIVPIKRWRAPAKGTLRIVSMDGRRVQIEGLGRSVH